MGFEFNQYNNNSKFKIATTSVAKNNTFKTKFYDDFEEIDYSDTSVAEYQNIDINKGIEDAVRKDFENKQKRLDETNKFLESISSDGVLTEEELKEASERLKDLDFSPEAQSLALHYDDMYKNAVIQREAFEAEQERNEKSKELEQLYEDREKNNGLFNPKEEGRIESEILKLEKELGVPHKPDGWETFKKDPLKATAASTANLAISLVKGVGQLGEAVLDGVTMIGGGVVSIATGIYDAGQAVYGAVTGNEWESATKAMWSKGLMPFVSKEYVNGVSDSFYQTKAGEWLDDNSVGWFKSDGIACEIGSATGYVAGIVVVTLGTAGVVTAATGVATAASSTSTIVSTGLSAVAATGKAGSKNFNKLKNEDGTFDNVTGTQIAKAVSGSYVSGAVEGAAWYLTYGTGAEHLKSGVGKLSNVKYISKLAPTVTKAKMGIQFTKTVANANINAFATGTNVDWGETMIDATVNAGVAGVYEKFGTQLVKAGGKKMADFYNKKVLTDNTSIQQQIVEDGGFTVGDVADDVVLNNQDEYVKEFVKYTIEKGTSKVGGKAVKESYTEVVNGTANVIASAIGGN